MVNSQKILKIYLNLNFTSRCLVVSVYILWWMKDEDKLIFCLFDSWDWLPVAPELDVNRDNLEVSWSKQSCLETWENCHLPPMNPAMPCNNSTVLITLSSFIVEFSDQKFLWRKLNSNLEFSCVKSILKLMAKLCVMEELNCVLVTIESIAKI